MPSFSVIVGPPAALDEALADGIRTAKVTNPLAPVTVVVGSGLLRPYLRHRLAELLDGHININLVTPAELADAFGAPLCDRRYAGNQNKE